MTSSNVWRDAIRKVERFLVWYHVHIVTKEGRPAVLKSISSPERAMEAVSTVLREGTMIDAWPGPGAAGK